MTDPILGIRLYRMDDGDGTRFTVTDGDHILLATADFRRAARSYAMARGIPVGVVMGPTHSAEEELELLERMVYHS